MFNFAIGRDLLESNPAHATSRPTPERSCERRLNDDELRDLLTALEVEPLRIAALFKLPLPTAARQSQLCRMPWAELDLDKARWTLPVEPVERRPATSHPVER